MTRDNLVFTICGFLIGLTLGSLVLGPRVARWKWAGAAPTAQTTPAVPNAPNAATPPAASGENPMAMVMQQLGTLKATVERDPRNFEALSQLGNLYMQAAKYPQAIDYYQRALAVRDDANVRTDLGICLKESGRLDQSLEAFRAVRKETPGQWQALFNEIIVLAEMRRFDEARALVPELERQRPNDPEVARLKLAVASAK